MKSKETLGIKTLLRPFFDHFEFCNSFPLVYFLYTLLLLFFILHDISQLGQFNRTNTSISFEDRQDQIEPTFQAFLDRLGFSLIYHFIMKRLILYIIPKGPTPPYKCRLPDLAVFEHEEWRMADNYRYCYILQLLAINCEGDLRIRMLKPPYFIQAPHIYQRLSELI